MAHRVFQPETASHAGPQTNDSKRTNCTSSAIFWRFGGSGSLRFKTGVRIHNRNMQGGERRHIPRYNWQLMNTCKTCKWWKWDNITRHYVRGAWTASTHFRCAGPCISDDDLSGMIDAQRDTGIITGPDFGCIHYQETQEQLPEDHPGRAEQKAELDRRSEGMTQEEAWRTGMPYR